MSLLTSGSERVPSCHELEFLIFLGDTGPPGLLGGLMDPDVTGKRSSDRCNGTYPRKVRFDHFDPRHATRGPSGALEVGPSPEHNLETFCDVG